MVEVIILAFVAWIAWSVGAVHGRIIARAVNRECPRCKDFDYAFKIDEIEQDGRLYSFEGIGKLGGRGGGKFEVPEGMVEAIIREVQENGNSQSN